MAKNSLENINWVDVEKFFYVAMQKGWVSGKKPHAMLVPGYRGFEYVRTPYKLVDMWVKMPGSNNSSGVTTIYFDTVNGASSPPIQSSSVLNERKKKSKYTVLWAMHYGGFYTPEASAVVQHILRLAYEKPAYFSGCRGWKRYEKDGLKYENHVFDSLPRRFVSREGNFKSFGGYEDVTNEKGEFLGFHRYFGRAHV